MLVADPAQQGGAVAAAMEERGIPFHLFGPAALFQRPEVRDAIAWLRVLADPDDSAAAARALTRPPVELRSGDLARLTTIARRRKLDMVAACEAALDSPQFQPEARERIGTFLKLYAAAAATMEERRADVFVRRLIEQVGLRRQRLFAAQPEVAERLLGLSRLAELATAWTRREPHGSTRGFVAYLSAVAEAGVEPEDGRGAARARGRCAAWPPARSRASASTTSSCSASRRRPSGSGSAGRRAAASSSRGSSAAPTARRRAPPASTRRRWRRAERPRRRHEEELFGPAEGLHATYRTLREQVLEASWRAGRELSEPRLDTAIDVNRAIARYLELLKLAALAQRPGDEPTAEAIEAVNGLLRQVATPEQQAELDASALDAYLLDSERERGRRLELVAAREEPSLAAFLPRRGDGMLSLSASDLSLYLTCPLKYKFARVFGIPQEPTINQRFGILFHNVLERFHKEPPANGEEGLRVLNRLFEEGWRRTGFGTSDDELQFRDRAREALRLYWERERLSEGEPVWLEKKFDFKVGDHHVRGRVDRVDRLPDGDYELIDYKTGERKSAEELDDDLQLALYRMAAREAWGIEASTGSYYYVLDAEKVPAPTRPDDAERVERTVLQVGEGILCQDFEPRPSPNVCSWCDYRLICPAAEAELASSGRMLLGTMRPARRVLSLNRSHHPLQLRRGWSPPFGATRREEGFRLRFDRLSCSCSSGWVALYGGPPPGSSGGGGSPAVTGPARPGAWSWRERPLASWSRRRAGGGTAGTRGRGCRRRGARPRRRAGRPVRPRSVRPALRSPGWRRRRGRSAPRSRSVSSSSSEASTAIPVSPSSRRSRASAAFGFGTAAT